MLINIPSKEETITYFHVKINWIVMFHRRLSKYFFHCLQLGISFPVTPVRSTVTGWNGINIHTGLLCPFYKTRSSMQLHN